MYNTLTKAVLAVDEELRQCLQENKLDIDPTLLNPLKKYGIITEDETDELKIHRLRHNQLKYNTNRSSFLVFTTYSCNLKCPYCYEGVVVSPESSSAYMGPETTSQVVTFMKNQTLLNRSSTVGIGLYGGEPLLNLDCCETLLTCMGQWCSENHLIFYATCTTNGTLLDKAYPRIGKYLSSVHVTLDGSQVYHDKKRIRKDGSPTYTDILNNLELLRTTKEHLSIRLTVDEENRHSIEEVLTDLESIGLKGRPHFHIYFAQVVPQNACLTFPTDDKYYTVTRDSIMYLPPLMKMAQEKGWGDHLAFDIGQEHTLVPSNIMSCDYVKHGMYSLDPLGDIYMCPASAGDTQYCIGKIHKGIPEWNAAYYNIITRDPSLIDLCAACEYLPACGGGCAIASHLKYKDYSTTFCNFTKDIIYERITAHLRLKYPEKFKESEQ